MILRYGAVVAQASGSLGGICFYNRRGNPVASARPRRTTSPTDDQITHRATTAAAIHNWANLTSSNRLAWALFAMRNVRLNRLGVTRQLSPFQFYLKENALRAQIGATLRSNPPTKGQQGIGTLDNISFTATGPYTVECTPPTNDPHGYYIVYGARPCKTSTTGRLFWRLVYAAHCEDSFSVDVYDEWTAIFGEMASGERYSLRIRYAGDFSIASAPATLFYTVA